MGAGSLWPLRLDPHRAGRSRALSTHLAQGGGVPAVPDVAGQTRRLPFPEEERDRAGGRAGSFSQHLSRCGEQKAFGFGLRWRRELRKR